MAKAEVKCTCKKCGSEFVKVAYKHNRPEAESWEAWAKDYFDICPDCLKAEKAAPAVEMIGDAELTGSPKQIAWATDIRVSLIQKSIEFSKNFTPGQDELIKSCFDWIIGNKTDSRFWIDNRNAENIFTIENAMSEWNASLQK